MLTLKANAKINMHLDILGKRPDRFHELETIFQSVELFDIVKLEIAPEISLKVSGDAPSDESNLAFIAAKLFFEYCQIDGGVNIQIEKHIPKKAGLGGASADAAAMLYGLNTLYHEQLTSLQLKTMAAKLGADVAFFLTGGTAAATGIGEKLSATQNSFNCYYLILVPKGEVGTPECYAKYDELFGASGMNLPPKNALLAVKSAVDSGNISEFNTHSFNALETPARLICPEIRVLLDGMRELSPAFLTGSGSACVGLFKSRAKAEAAMRILSGKFKTAYLVRAANSGLEIITKPIK